MRGAIMPAIVTSLLKASIIKSRTYKGNLDHRVVQPSSKTREKESSPALHVPNGAR